MVSSSQGLPVFSSAMPPHRSATFFAPVIGGESCPHLGTLVEVPLERLAYRLETRRHPPVDRRHRDLPIGGLPIRPERYSSTPDRSRAR